MRFWQIENGLCCSTQYCGFREYIILSRRSLAVELSINASNEQKTYIVEGRRTVVIKESIDFLNYPNSSQKKNHVYNNHVQKGITVKYSTCALSYSLVQKVT